MKLFRTHFSKFLLTIFVGILFVFLFTSLPTKTFAASLRQRYVNTASAGGDGTTNETSGSNAAYSSLSAAITAEAGNLVTADVYLVINCSGTTPDATKASVTGFTTDTTHYVEIQGNNTDGKIDSGDYTLAGINIISNNVKVHNLISSAGLGIANYSTTINAYVYNNIIYSTAGPVVGNGGGAAGGPWYVYNNIIYRTGGDNYSDAVKFGTASAITIYFYNNTVDSNGTGDTIWPTVSNPVVFIAKNNIAIGHGGSRYDYYETNFNALSINNLSSDASAKGTNPIINAVLSFVNKAGRDYHLTALDTPAIGAGADLSADASLSFSTDINGLARTLPWDVGATKYITPPPVLSFGSPTGTISAGTTATTLSVVTNENATCKYSTIANTAYPSMSDTFSTTGGMTHSTSVSGLSNGNTHTYYIRCTDASNNSDTSDYPITFSVSNPDLIPPTPGIISSSNITSTTITLTTIGASDNIALASAPYRYHNVTTNTYSPVASTPFTFTGLTPNTSYTFEVGVQDINGNWATSSQQSTNTAVFTHTITTSAGDYGSISPSGSVSVADGSDQTFTINPVSSAYRVNTLTVDGSSVTPSAAYTFNNVITTHTISATFVNSARPAESRWWNAAEVPFLNVLTDMPHGNGTIYYIDGKNGSDSNNGLSAGSAYKTISKAVNRYGPLKGGDTIAIKAGKYYEHLDIGKSGGYGATANNPIVIGPYGDGEVIIDPSHTSQMVWSKYDQNIYVADWNFTVFGNISPPGAVVMDGNFKQCKPVYNLSDVTSYCQWYYDSSARKIYLYTNGDDPTSHDSIVTISDWDNGNIGITLTSDYITLYGLTIRGAGSYGITTYLQGGQVTGTKIEKCNFEFNGKPGVGFFGNHNSLIKTRIYGNVLMNWPRGKTWGSTGGWPTGTLVSRDDLIKGNVITDNGGEGTGSMTHEGRNTWDDNIVGNNWSVNIYPDSQPNDIISNNLIYCENPDINDVIQTDHIPAGSTVGTIFHRMRPEGIMTGDETASSLIPLSANHQIYNNIIIGCRRGITNYSQLAGSGLNNFTYANNTIIVPNAVGVGESFVGIAIQYNGGNNVNTVFKNNIIYASNPSTYLLYGESSSTDPDKFRGVTFDHNIFYHTASVTPFHWGPTYSTNYDYSFTNWQNLASPGELTGNIFADPKLTDPTKFTSAGAYPQSTSPAINAGVSTLFTTDYNGNPRPQGTAFDMGALEYLSGYNPPPSPPSDTTVPILSSGAPTGPLPSGTTQVTMTVTTSENATCRYSATGNTTYANMTNTFSTTAFTNHSTIITGSKRSTT